MKRILINKTYSSLTTYLWSLSEYQKTASSFNILILYARVSQLRGVHGSKICFKKFTLSGYSGFQSMITLPERGCFI